jgi:hypothetical protein
MGRKIAVSETEVEACSYLSQAIREAETQALDKMGARTEGLYIANKPIGEATVVCPHPPCNRRLTARIDASNFPKTVSDHSHPDNANLTGYDWSEPPTQFFISGGSCREQKMTK